MTVLAPILIGLLYVTLSSRIPEPQRQRFNAILVAGAGAAYLSSDAVGPLELVFTTVATACAYRGLRSWHWIGVAWLLHTGWDALHHLRGAPILPFVPHSSLGCAICDPVIALWCFAGGNATPPPAHPRAERDPAPADAGAGGRTRSPTLAQIGDQPIYRLTTRTASAARADQTGAIRVGRPNQSQRGG